MNNFNDCHPSENSASHAANMQTLSHVAFLANRLAKQLSGRDRALAYQIKSEALSALVVSRVATVNGLRPDNTLGFDFFSARLHCPYSSLTSQAQAIVRREARSAPAVAPLSARLNEEQIRNIREHFPRASDKRRTN